MKTSRLLFLATCVLILIACNKTPRQATPHTPDPVSQLKALIETLQHPRFDVSEGEDQFNDIKYDVRKTDSLVSPFTATVLGDEYVLAHGTHEIAFWNKFVLTLNYQEGKWSFAHCTGTSYGLKEKTKLDYDEDGRMGSYGHRDFGLASNAVQRMHLDPDFP